MFVKKSAHGSIARVCVTRPFPSKLICISHTAAKVVVVELDQSNSTALAS